MNNFAALLLAERKLDEAEPIFRDAVEKSRRLLGEDHPYTLYFMMNVGNVLKEKGALPEAESVLRIALERRQRVLGKEHIETLATVESLAAVLIAAKRLGEAEPLVRGGWEISKRTIGDDHPQTLRMVAQLGDLLVEQGRPDAAEPLLADLYSRTSRVQMSPRPAATCMARWGPCLTKLRRFAAAEAPLLEAQRRLQAAGLERDPQMQKVVAALVEVYVNTDRNETADAWRAQQARLLLPASAPSDPMLAAQPGAK
jgi:tetratricopeptide (TPR) repeat protein